MEHTPKKDRYQSVSLVQKNNVGSNHTVKPSEEEQYKNKNKPT